MEKEIINKVANSKLEVFDLEDYFPKEEIIALDISQWLFEGFILKEKDFREFIKAHDWSQYAGKNVAITCSEDAIVPTWAYMLLAIQLEPYAHMVVFGSLADLETKLYEEALSKINFQEYEGTRVVVKGCSKVSVPTSAYVEITRRLRPYAQSIMFGEPCSTVPLYKKPKV